MRAPKHAAAISLVICLVGAALTSEGQTPARGTLTLTNAAQIRQLTEDEAAKAVPVHLQGVMLSYAGAPPLESGEKPFVRVAFVISDPTACIYVLGPSAAFSNLHQGDLLEVDGVTDPGQFAPFVIAKTGRRLGSAPIPEPKSVNFQQLVTGGLDAQWVEVSGIVRSWEYNDPKFTNGPWHSELAMAGNKVTITFDQPRPALVEPDAEVRVKSLCFYRFSVQRQALRPTLAASQEFPIEVLKPASLAPFDTPLSSIASILQFSAASVSGHRVHVHGVVTFYQLKQTLWIRDSSGVATIQTRQNETLEPGDEVEVLGFPEYGSGLTVMNDAVFKKVKSGTPVEPWPITSLDDAFNHDQDLVSVDALLTDVQPVLGGKILTLVEKEQSITAVLRTRNTGKTSDTWKTGSRVRVIGICSVVRDDSDYTLAGIWRPQSFQILLRSPNDLKIIKLPDWWTPNHIAQISGVISAALLVVTAVVMWRSRRNLREQAQSRATAQAEFAAILSERNRMAREIHDTLAQGLTAISVQLRLAKKEDKANSGTFAQYLETAQELVRSSLDEARNSIWDMRSQVLENGNLAEALDGILKQMSCGTSMKARFELEGEVRRLAPMVENNILRIGQEAITNATKHSNANQIDVKLEFAQKHFSLTVEDNGIGFDPARPKPSEGGFGLIGMKERTTDLRGELNVSSRAGQGTKICLSVPLLD